MLTMEHCREDPPDQNQLEPKSEPVDEETPPMSMAPAPMTPTQNQQIVMPRQLSFEQNCSLEERSRISSLFNEICIEAEAFHPHSQPPKTEENGAKKLKKRKSELALEMSSDEIDTILGADTTNGSFNPNNPFGPSPSNVTNGFGEIHSPPEQKASPPLTKYSQNNQGQRNSPQSAAYQMSPFQMNSPLHSPNPLLMHHHHLPHHTRLLQHQQSAPNLRQGVFDDLPMPSQLMPLPATKPFDQTLVEEFEMCVRVIMMAANRAQCRNVYRQLTAEVSELYSRVVKNQVPKKAVKKIVATRSHCTPNEQYELERQFKCLSDGLESRRSTQLYESIVNFLYKMRIAIPDM
ncbi:unnamed protein product [Caenorhabditis angaria]|uniref:Uncharacterized protein n=1 Tax=Caenorhabditis angaria TaxID=860376 RepID=A0A9P1I1X0_9PELO|nr:unnamed protein product [Caenorhabditis angaria]